MTYRAPPITQRDGSPQQYSNCRLASGATGLDFQTQGRKRSTGAEMRTRSGDPSGGTTSDDIVRAWKTYDEQLGVGDGRTWDDAVALLREGHLVHIDVWHATVGGPCMSGSGRYGHTMAIAPEVNSAGKWLVSDPWCLPPKWTWWDASRLRAGAEDWARRVRESTRGDKPRADDFSDIPEGELRDAVRRLMARWDPGHPAPGDEEEPPPADTSGPAPIMFTVTKAQESDDVAIQAPESLTSDYTVKTRDGLPFYADSALTEKLGTLSAATRPYVGLVVGASSRGIIVNTGTVYGDKEPRPTVVYIAEDAVDPVQGPPDMTSRDQEWRRWLNTDANAPDKR